jgi:hypothetical protein
MLGGNLNAYAYASDEQDAQSQSASYQQTLDAERGAARQQRVAPKASPQESTATSDKRGVVARILSKLSGADTPTIRNPDGSVGQAQSDADGSRWNPAGLKITIIESILEKVQGGDRPNVVDVEDLTGQPNLDQLAGTKLAPRGGPRGSMGSGTGGGPEWSKPRPATIRNKHLAGN